MIELAAKQILDGLGFCHENGIVPATDDECCPYCGATAHGVEMTRLAKEILEETERLQSLLSRVLAAEGRCPTKLLIDISRVLA